MNESTLREEIIRVARLVAAQGLARSTDGNISVRLGPGRLLITPSGLYKMNMSPDDLVIVDDKGRLLEARDGRRPTAELALHLEAYRQRPDIGAVLHAHPPYTTALTLVGLPFPTDYMPEVMVLLGQVPTAPYARPLTPELAASISDLIQTHDNIVLSHHGTISVGRTLEQALIALERMEAVAHTYHLARALGEPIPLPPAELEALVDMGASIRQEGGSPGTGGAEGSS
jgi:L-fuculose-phosphate aldolase